MGEIIDRTGKRFGRLIVIKQAGRNKYGQILWKCVCDCGSTIVAQGGNLQNGCTKSCGCLKKETIGALNKTHGMTGTSAYGVWKHIIQRCNNQNSKDYKDYGGRGITVCIRWLKFENFLEDMGERSPELSIDRKNNDLGYFKENCRWATIEMQRRNQRLRKANRTGVKGVFFHKKTGKYQASIAIKNKSIYLGTFKTVEEAAEARRLGEIKYWGKSYA
jgi:hypothetical protein